MAYSTLADMTATTPEQAVINLTDDSGVGVVDQDKVSAAIADADAEIDSYCAARYTVPFDPVPAVVRKCSVDIAVYNIYSRYAEKVPETREARYKNAIKLLENIAKGVVTIGETVAPPPVSSGGGKVSAPGRIFSAEKMESY